VRIAPGDASSGAFAVVAFPLSALTRAFVAVVHESAARRIGFAAVRALRFFLEDALSGRISHVIVRAFAARLALIAIGANKIFLQGAALAETVSVFLRRFTSDDFPALPNGSFAHAFYWSPGVVFFDDRFFLVVILSIIMASAVFYRNTDSVLVLHFSVGTSAAFGADSLAALRPNGYLTTSVLAAVDALLKHLAGSVWWALDGTF